MRLFLVSGTVLGFLSVALGAFAAHALRDRLDAYRLGVFQTGVQYQFFHALALCLVALWLARSDASLVRTAGWAFLVGSAVFSGSLYLLALTGVKLWGAVTPIGGVAFLAGWACLIAAAVKG